MYSIARLYWSIGCLLLAVILASCGQPPALTEAPTSTPAVATPTIIETMSPLPPVDTIVPTPVPPVTQLPEPTTVPTEVPTASPTPPLPTNTPLATEVPTTSGTSWTTVDWEGLVVSIPPTYTHEVEQLTDVFAAPGATIRSRLTLIPPGSPNAAPIRMTLEVVEGLDIDAYLEAVRQMGSERPLIDEISIERVLVAGFPGVRYAQDAKLPTRNYVLVRPDNYGLVRPDALLLMSLDVTDDAQIRVVDTLTSNVVVPPPTTATTTATEGKIAFLQNGDIVVHDFATGEFIKVTSLGSVSDLAWSPDGSQLVFTAGSGISDIFQIDADGGNLVRLTENDTLEFFPRWAADGSLYWVQHQFGSESPLVEIVHREGDVDVVVHTEPGGLCGPINLRLGPQDQFGLVVNCGRGTNVLLGSFSLTTTIDLAESYLTPELGCAYDVGWTEDLLIALTSVECLPQENTTLTSIDIATKQTAALFSDKGIGSFAVASDGNTLAFDKFGEGGTAGGLWLLNLDAPGEPRQLGADGSRGAWRPTTP